LAMAVGKVADEVASAERVGQFRTRVPLAKDEMERDFNERHTHVQRNWMLLHR
jgi:hypothetical protein